MYFLMPVGKMAGRSRGGNGRLAYNASDWMAKHPNFNGNNYVKYPGPIPALIKPRAEDKSAVRNWILHVAENFVVASKSLGNPTRQFPVARLKKSHGIKRSYD